MERRTFLRTTGAGLAATVGAGRAAANGDSDAEENPTPADGSTPYRAKVNEIRSPLSGVPTVERTGDRLRVELDGSVDPATASAHLEPSFGGPVQVELRRVGVERDPEGSRIWNEAEGESEEIVVAEYRIPAFGESFTPDLYDLVVEWDGGSDRQPRAVSVKESIPAEPEVAVIADPQIGDPRALRSGAEESQGRRSPDPFLQRARRVFGTSPDDRWAATRRAIAEVNALDPDIVLVAGDLCLGQDVPGKFYAEYEDAWTVMNQVRAPTFMTCGNHDAYVQSGTDGKALYRETFGPPSYSVAVGDLQVVAVDTYDWTYLDRLGASAAVSTYGGQVRDAQLAWLDGALRDAAADGQSILAFGHHNPSWRPDPKNDYYEETDGRPVFEQFARGSRYAESGQGWTGENAFALRRLFDETGVDAFFCGHSHRDRVARSMADRDTSGVTPGPDVDGDGDDDGYGDGGFDGDDYADIVATVGTQYVRQRYSDDQPRGVENYPRGEAVQRADPDTAEGAALAADIRDTGAGTLYVNVASTMSSTAEYWGWRLFDHDTRTDGLDPARLRYPMTREFLDERAVNEEVWNPDHDEVGLFSVPSYLLSVEDEGSASGPRGRRIRIENDQAVDRSGALRISTTADDPQVRNGEVVWRRDAGPKTDLKIAYEVDAGRATLLRIDAGTSGVGQ